MKTYIRFILDEPQSASFNMAADLFLLKKCIQNSVIFVRFYHWERPTITIGYNQKPEQLLETRKVYEADFTWIRRPTGGRAVLHYNDITYCCVFSKQIVEMGVSIAETYAIIAACLKNGLQKSGISCSTYDSDLIHEKFSRESKLPCFLAPNRNEIMVNQKKLIGSAQKRTSQAVLQHGSIPLTGSFRTLPLYQKMNIADCHRQIELLETKSTCIQENLENFSTETFRNHLIEGFSDTLSVPTEIKAWSKKEKTDIFNYSQNIKFIERWLH